MATVNLGSIKFNWKGTYAGATAYKVDDVVSYNGSSYICIQASTGNLPTDTAYFEQMSSAGTNGTDGTDLTTTLTTQGDIVYRDGSGLQRLAKGTAGQALLMNSGATAPEWGSAGGDNLPMVIVNLDGTQVIPSATMTTVIFDYTIINTDNVYNTTNGAFTPNVAGYYLMKFQTGGASFTNTAGLKIRYNSQDHYIKDENVTSSYLEVGTKILYFNGSSDTANFQCYFTGGRTISGNTTNGNTRLEIYKLLT